jgi:transcription antitermination protein NusB
MNDLNTQSDQIDQADNQDLTPSDVQQPPHANPNMDPRHARRIHLMQQLFAYTFLDKVENQQQFVLDNPDLAGIITALPELDTEITQFAPERPLSDINKVDLAILRLVVFEWKQKSTPQKVLINEGVELAKEFGTESSPKFVNGVLAYLLKPENQE